MTIHVKRKKLTLMISISFAFFFGCCVSPSVDMNTSEVNLLGKKGVIILHNNLGNSLDLSGYFLEHVPFRNKKIEISLSSNEVDTIVNNYNFPDFLILETHPYNKSFRLFNGPNDTLHCYFSEKEGVLELTFKGDNTKENDYYLSAIRHFGGFQHEMGASSKVKNTLTDINQYTSIADSMLAESINFLADYDNLPPTFVDYETDRLKYSSAADRLSTFFIKEISNGGHLIVDSTYFALVDSLPIQINEDRMSGSYLTFTDSYFVYYSKKKYPPEKKTLSSVFGYIDNIYPPSTVSDILKVRNLRWIYKKSISQYDSLTQKLVFSKKIGKNRLDSLFSTKNRLPENGSKIRDLILVNYKGDKHRLSEFGGEKMTIVNLWASWCKPCISEFVYENKLHLAYKDSGITVVNICLETSEASWREMSEKHELQMVNLFFDENYSNLNLKELKAELGLEELPRSILLKKDLVVWNNVFSRASQLRQRDIDSLLNQAY